MRNPPAWAVRLLRALLADRDRDMIVGDLLEEFQHRGSEPEHWYVRQVLSFLSLARLMRLVPLRVAGALVAGVAECIVFWALPTLAGVRPEWGAFSIVGAALCVYSILVIVRELSTADVTAFAGKVAVSWFLPFGGVVAWIFYRPEFSPIPAVPAFLVCVLGASLQAAAKSGRVAIGVSAAVTTGILAAWLAGVTLHMSGVPHPPLQTLPFLPGVAAFVGAVGGLVGSTFWGSRNQTALSLRLAA